MYADNSSQARAGEHGSSCSGASRCQVLECAWCKQQNEVRLFVFPVCLAQVARTAFATQLTKCYLLVDAMLSAVHTHADSTVPNTDLSDSLQVVTVRSACLLKSTVRFGISTACL